jgi:hypothetical protein
VAHELVQLGLEREITSTNRILDDDVGRLAITVFFVHLISPPLCPLDEFPRATRPFGGQLRLSRKRDDLSNCLDPLRRSQKFLLPDLVIEREGETPVIEAKF